MVLTLLSTGCLWGLDLHEEPPSIDGTFEPDFDGLNNTRPANFSCGGSPSFVAPIGDDAPFAIDYVGTGQQVWVAYPLDGVLQVHGPEEMSAQVTIDEAPIRLDLVGNLDDALITYSTDTGVLHAISCSRSACGESVSITEGVDIVPLTVDRVVTVEAQDRDQGLFVRRLQGSDEVRPVYSVAGYEPGTLASTSWAQSQRVISLRSADEISFATYDGNDELDFSAVEFSLAFRQGTPVLPLYGATAPLGRPPVWTGLIARGLRIQGVGSDFVTLAESNHAVVARRVYWISAGGGLWMARLGVQVQTSNLLGQSELPSELRAVAATVGRSTDLLLLLNAGGELRFYCHDISTTL